MSIINQALKKAQREQLLCQPPSLPGMRHADTAAQAKPWFVIIAGFAVALGLGAILHSWLSVPMIPGLGDDVASETMPESTIATPHLVSVPRPVTPPTQQVTIIPALNLSSIDTPGQSSEPDTRPRNAVSAGQYPTLALSSPPYAVSSLPPAVTSSLPPTLAPLTRSAEAARRDRPRAQTLFNQALESQAAGAVERTRLLLEQALQYDPTLIVAYNSLGNLYYQQQQYQQAITMYERALALDPQYAKARNNLGSTYLRLDMDDQALAELHKALQADSEYGLAYYNLACVYARAGDSLTAAQYLQQAITFEPQARTWAQTDNDFATVRATPVVQKLLGP
jgi:Tfp pilus assembly protein PilF